MKYLLAICLAIFGCLHGLSDAQLEETVAAVTNGEPKQEEPKQEEPGQKEAKEKETGQEEPKQEEPKQEEPGQEEAKEKETEQEKAEREEAAVREAERRLITEACNAGCTHKPRTVGGAVLCSLEAQFSTSSMTNLASVLNCINSDSCKNVTCGEEEKEKGLCYPTECNVIDLPAVAVPGVDGSSVAVPADGDSSVVARQCLPKTVTTSFLSELNMLLSKFEISPTPTLKSFLRCFVGARDQELCRLLDNDGEACLWVQPDSDFSTSCVPKEFGEALMIPIGDENGSNREYCPRVKEVLEDLGCHLGCANKPQNPHQLSFCFLKRQKDVKWLALLEECASKINCIKPCVRVNVPGLFLHSICVPESFVLDVEEVAAKIMKPIEAKPESEAIPGSEDKPAIAAGTSDGKKETVTAVNMLIRDLYKNFRSDYLVAANCMSMRTKNYCAKPKKQRLINGRLINACSWCPKESRSRNFLQLESFTEDDLCVPSSAGCRNFALSKPVMCEKKIDAVGCSSGCSFIPRNTYEGILCTAETQLSRGGLADLAVLQKCVRLGDAACRSPEEPDCRWSELKQNKEILFELCVPETVPDDVFLKLRQIFLDAESIDKRTTIPNVEHFLTCLAGSGKSADICEAIRNSKGESCKSIAASIATSFVSCVPNRMYDTLLRAGNNFEYCPLVKEALKNTGCVLGCTKEPENDEHMMVCMLKALGKNWHTSLQPCLPDGECEEHCSLVSSPTLFSSPVCIPEVLDLSPAKLMDRLLLVDRNAKPKNTELEMIDMAVSINDAMGPLIASLIAKIPSLVQCAVHQTALTCLAKLTEKDDETLCKWCSKGTSRNGSFLQEGLAGLCVASSAPCSLFDLPDPPRCLPRISRAFDKPIDNLVQLQKLACEAGSIRVPENPLQFLIWSVDALLERAAIVSYDTYRECRSFPPRPCRVNKQCQRLRVHSLDTVGHFQGCISADIPEDVVIQLQGILSNFYVVSNTVTATILNEVLTCLGGNNINECHALGCDWASLDGSKVCIPIGLEYPASTMSSSEREFCNTSNERSQVTADLGAVLCYRKPRDVYELAHCIGQAADREWKTALSECGMETDMCGEDCQLLEDEWDMNVCIPISMVDTVETAITDLAAVTTNISSKRVRIISNILLKIMYRNVVPDGDLRSFTGCIGHQAEKPCSKAGCFWCVSNSLCFYPTMKTKCDAFKRSPVKSLPWKDLDDLKHQACDAGSIRVPENTVQFLVWSVDAELGKHKVVYSNIFIKCARLDYASCNKSGDCQVIQPTVPGRRFVGCLPAAIPKDAVSALYQIFIDYHESSFGVPDAWFEDFLACLGGSSAQHLCEHITDKNGRKCHWMKSTVYGSKRCIPMDMREAASFKGDEYGLLLCSGVYRSVGCDIGCEFQPENPYQSRICVLKALSQAGVNKLYSCGVRSHDLFNIRTEIEKNEEEEEEEDSNSALRRLLPNPSVETAEKFCSKKCEKVPASDVSDPEICLPHGFHRTFVEKYIKPTSYTLEEISQIFHIFLGDVSSDDCLSLRTEEGCLKFSNDHMGRCTWCPGRENDFFIREFYSDGLCISSLYDSCINYEYLDAVECSSEEDPVFESIYSGDDDNFVPPEALVFVA